PQGRPQRAPSHHLRSRLLIVEPLQVVVLLWAGYSCAAAFLDLVIRIANVGPTCPVLSIPPGGHADVVAEEAASQQRVTARVVQRGSHDVSVSNRVGRI